MISFNNCEDVDSEGQVEVQGKRPVDERPRHLGVLITECNVREIGF
jgi:hypothetical protein